MRKSASGKRVNRYVYANNSPYRYVDPDGRAAVVIVDILQTIIITASGGRKKPPGRPIEDPFETPSVGGEKSDPFAKLKKAFGPTTSSTPPPPPDDEDEKVEYRKPNSKLETGDKLDMAKFDQGVKIEGNVYFKDQKSGFMISPDRAGTNSHGGSAFKLVDRVENRVATLSKDGVVLRK